MIPFLWKPLSLVCTIQALLTNRLVLFFIHNQLTITAILEPSYQVLKITNIKCRYNYKNNYAEQERKIRPSKLMQTRRKM